MSNSSVKRFDPCESGLDIDPFDWLERVFVYFLQGLFEHEALEGTGMRWCPDEKHTEMLIAAEKPRPEVLEKTPALTVVVGQARWAQLGMDQLAAASVNTAERTHADMLSATVGYHCQSKDGKTGRRIAWWASKYTNVFRRLIQKVGGLHHVGMAHTITGETAPGQHIGPRSVEELITSVVTIPVFWQDSWHIDESCVTETLKQVNVGLNVRAYRPRDFTVGGRLATSIPIDEYKRYGEEQQKIVLTQNICAGD